MTTERVTVICDGRAFGGWKSVEVEADLAQAARRWQVTGTPFWPEDTNPVKFKPGAACQIFAGEDLLVTGYVDSVSLAVASDSTQLTLAGRSRTEDIVDCSVAESCPSSFTNTSLLEIAQRLCSPYAISVDTPVPITDRISNARINRDDAVFNALERLANLYGYMLTDNTAGNLVIQRAGTVATSTVLDTTRWLDVSVQCNADQLYSDYLCRGQRAETDTDFGAAIAHAFAVTIDPGVNRFRFLRVGAAGHATQAACQSRILWEAASRAGRAVQVSGTVQGWRDSARILWEPNTLVRVTDQRIAVDATLLLVSCKYTQGDDGTKTALKLQPVEAFSLTSPKHLRPAGVWQ